VCTRQIYVLPINRHRRLIAITEDDPTRKQLPTGVSLSDPTPP
jgi:hypothetical protein